MKNTLQLIKSELNSEDGSFPILTVCKLTRLYINKDLISFIKRLLATSTDDIEREKMASKLKKLLLQEPRLPDPDQFKAQPEEFRQFFIEIETEQALYDPLKWLDAELEFIKQSKLNKMIPEDKLWLSREEVMRMFDFSITTLNRRIADNMPCKKLGGKVMFNRQKIYEWLENLKE
jgi:hypothetical protein